MLDGKGTEEMVAQETSRGSEDGGFPFPNLGMTEEERVQEGASRSLGGSKRD